MGLESFYGGRQGASFVIVKRFDGLDIPQVEGSYVYRYIIVATNGLADEDKKYYVDDYNRLIESTGSNYKLYDWEKIELKEDIILTNVIWANSEGKTSDPEPVELKRTLAQGMVQLFQEGGNTTNIVNYGEYVLIDTVGVGSGEGGLCEKNNPDNGKIFRRGMNFIYNAETNPLAGAEYIGQIMGPKGDCPELDMDTVKNISEIAGSDQGRYEPTIENGGLIPGKDGDEFNDDIIYAWVTLRDKFGDVRSAIIGFTFPYLVLEFTATQRSAYYVSAEEIPSWSTKHVGDILDDNFDLIARIDDGEHPFYEKWAISLPHGVKGDTLDQLGIYPSRPYPGSTMYSDSACTIEVGEAVGTEEVNIQEYNSSLSYIKLTNGNYIESVDGWKTRIRCRKWNYDNKNSGDWVYLDVGEYNLVKNIVLDPSGHFVVDYTYDNSQEYFLTTIIDARIKTRSSSTADEGSGNQKLEVTYSYLSGAPNVVREIGEPINYVLDTYVVPESSATGYKGCLLVYYSDPVRREASPIKDLLFPSARLGKSVKGWTNLGDIKGYTQTPLSFGEYDSFDLIPNNPPEVIMQNDRYAGWGAIYTNNDVKYIAEYDYARGMWREGIPYGDGLTDPAVVINYAPAPGELDGLAKHGFRVDTTRRKVENENLAHGVVNKINKKITSSISSTIVSYISTPVGPEVRYVGAQQNSNTHNLEEQLILGTDTDNLVTEEIKVTVGGHTYFEKKISTDYKVDGSEDNYYTLEKTIKQELASTFNNNTLTINISPNISEKIEKLSYSSNEAPHEQKQTSYYYSYGWIYNDGSSIIPYYTKNENPEVDDIIYSDIKASVDSGFKVTAYNVTTNQITITGDKVCDRDKINNIIIDTVSDIS